VPRTPLLLYDPEEAFFFASPTFLDFPAKLIATLQRFGTVHDSCEMEPSANKQVAFHENLCSHPAGFETGGASMCARRNQLIPILS
jgi:hypothetical protein